MLPIAKRCGSKLFRGFLLPFLAITVALAGCGDNRQGQHGTFVVVTPYTPPPASGAISTTTTPQDLIRIQITILDTSGIVLVGPTDFSPGQTARIDVESGDGRIVRVRGFDAANDMLYQGKSSPVSLATDETRTVAVDLYGKLLKGSVNLTNAQKIRGLGDGQTTAASTTAIAADDTFRLSLPDGVMRPYLLYGINSASAPVGAAIVDGPGTVSLDPLSTFQASVLTNPLSGQSGVTSPKMIDLANAWSGWGVTGQTQATAITQADQAVQGGIGLTTLGISGYRIGHGIPTAIADLLTYNPMQVTWTGGQPSLVKTTGGTVASSPNAGVVTSGGAVLTLPASSVGSSVTVARTAASTEWLLWKTGGTQIAGIALPASVSGQPATIIGQAMSHLADILTLYGEGTGLDPASGGTGLTTFLTNAAERLILQQNDSALHQQTLTSLQNTVLAIGFSPTAPLPVVAATSLNTSEDTAVTTILTAISAQSTSLTFNIASQPTHGTASIIGNQLTYSPATNFSGSGSGSDTLTLTATDSNGTSMAATIAIAVAPMNDPPAPSAAAISANSGLSGTTTVFPNDPDTGDTHTFAIAVAPTQGSATVSNTGVITYIAPASFAGTNGLLVTVTDGAGATGSVSVSITVTDATAPIVTPPANISVAATGPGGTSASNAAIAAFLAGATAADNVDGIISTIFTATPTTFPIGTTTVTFSAPDAANNTGTASATVTIGDQTAPVVTAPTSVIVTAVDASGTPKTATAITTFLGAASATDNVDGTITTITNDAPATFPLGVATTVTFSASDIVGNTATASATVTVTDQTGPLVTPPADTTLNATSGAGIAASDPAVQPFLNGASALDNVDGTIITITNDAPTTFPLGATTVTFSASDTAGNSGSATAVLTVGNQPPVVSNPGTFTSSEGEVVAKTITATDPEGQPLTFRAANLPSGLNIDGVTGAISGTIDFTAAGSNPYTVTVDVSDGFNTPVAINFVWNVTDLPLSSSYGWNRTAITTDASPSSNTLGLSGHQFLDAEGLAGDLYTLWIVGSDNYIDPYTLGSTSEGVAHVTHDGGITWNRVDLPSQQISFGVGLGASHEAYSLGFDTSGLPSLLAIDTYSQTVTPLPLDVYFQGSPLAGLNVTPNVAPAQDTLWLAGVDFLNYNIAMSVSSDAGATWSSRGIYPFTGIIPNITEAFFLGNNGWVAIDSSIWRTSDAGMNWIETTNVATSILGIHFSDPLNGWAVGPTGTLLRSTDGGVNWLPIANVNIGSRDLTEVFALDAVTAYIVSAQGDLFQTQDGGATWMAQVVDPTASGSQLAMIAMASPTFGVAVGRQPDNNLGGSRGIALQTNTGGHINTGPVSGTITAGGNAAPATVLFVPVTDPMTGQVLGTLQQVIGNGSYTVELAPGQYQIVTIPQSGSAVTTDPYTGGLAYLSTLAVNSDGQSVNLLLQDGYTTPIVQNLTLDPSTTITGTVRDELGRPIPNASVYLVDSGNGSAVAQAMSDSDGIYAIAAPQGNYILGADRAYTTFTASYRIDNVTSSGNSGAATSLTIATQAVAADIVLLHRATQPWSSDLVEGDPTWLGVATAPRDPYGQPVSPGLDLYAFAYGSDSITVGYDGSNRAIGDTLGVLEITSDGGTTWSRMVDPYTNAIFGVAPTQIGQGLYVAMARDPTSGQPINAVVKTFAGNVVLADPYGNFQTNTGIQAFGTTAMVPLLASDPYTTLLDTGMAISEDGGTTWDSMLFGNLYYSTTVGDLDIVDPYTAFVTTDNAIWRMDRVGGAWMATTVNSAVTWWTSSGSTLMIDFNSAQEGWAINNVPYNHQDVWHTADGGTTWTQLYLPTYAQLTDIAALDPYSALVTTTSGGAWVTHDGGATWTPSDTGLYQQNNLDWSLNYPAPNIRAVAAANPNRVFATAGFDVGQAQTTGTTGSILPPNGSALLHSETGGLAAGQVVQTQVTSGSYYEVRFMPVVDPVTGQLLAQAQTFPAGMFNPQVTVQLQPGSYVVQITDTMIGQSGWYSAADPYGWTSDANQATVVTTTVSASPQVLNAITPSAPGTILGNVFDVGGKAVAHWTVTALPVADPYGSVPNRSWWAYNMGVTDPYGSFNLSVPAGSWRLAVTPGDATNSTYSGYDYLSDLNTQYWIDPYSTSSAPEASGVITVAPNAGVNIGWTLQTPIAFNVTVLAGGVPQSGISVMGRHDGRSKDPGPLDGGFGSPFDQDLAITNGSGVAQLSAPPTALLNILVGSNGGNGSSATTTWGDRLTGAPYLPTWNGDTTNTADVSPTMGGASVAINMAPTVAISGTITGIPPAKTSDNDAVFAMPVPDASGHYQGTLVVSPWNASGQYHLDVGPGVYWVGAVVHGSFLYSTGTATNSTRLRTSAAQYTLTAAQTINFDVSNSNSLPLSGTVRVPAGWILDRIILTPTISGLAPIEIGGNGLGSEDISITRDIPFSGTVEDQMSYYVGVAVRQRLVQQSDSSIAGTLYRYWDGAVWHDATNAVSLPPFGVGGFTANLGLIDLTGATWPKERLSVQVLHNSGYWGEGMTRVEVHHPVTGIVLYAAENNPSWNNPGPAWLDGVVQLPVDPGNYRIKYADRFVWTGNNTPAAIDDRGTTMIGNMTTNTDPVGTALVTVTQGSGHQHLGIFRIP